MPIGLFDSGYGGLTILHGILDVLPQYSYLYVGDNARAPYGSRTVDEVYEFTRQGVEYLFSQGCDLVILACNTASASALRRLQQELLPTIYPDKKILGVLVPTIEQVTGMPWKNTSPAISAMIGTLTVGVLATELTVQSRAYELEIHKRNPSIRVIQQACPGLVEAIEQGASREELDQLVATYVASLNKKIPANAPLAAVLLGCTHYALIADQIQEHLPPAVKLYEQPKIVAQSLAIYLDAHPEIEQKLSRDAKRLFVTTGNAAEVSTQSQKYFGNALKFEAIKLN